MMHFNALFVMSSENFISMFVDVFSHKGDLDKDVYYGLNMKNYDVSLDFRIIELITIYIVRIHVE